MSRIASLLAVMMVSLVAGCQTGQKPAERALPPRDVIARINANSQRLQSLWSRINLYAELRDPETQKRHTVYATGGTLQYRAPGELRMRATKDLAGLLLDAGINSERYWVIAPEPGPDKMWWGYVQSESQSAQMPVRPQDLLAALAVRPIDPGTPGLRCRREGDAYLFTWSHEMAGRATVVREVAYDAETLLPKTVRLFDENGKAALEAKLSNYASVDAPSKPEPRVARLYELRFPRDGSEAQLRLLEMQVSRNGLPNDASFTFPARPPVAKVKQVGAEPAK